MEILNLFRTKQYVKNLIIFFPLFIDGGISSFQDLIYPFLIFAGFCLISSSVYIFNDIRDVAADRRHPVKKHRPLASGSISLKTAAWWWAGVLASGLLITAIASIYILVPALLYVLINVAYSSGLKTIAVADITVIAAGYVIRLYAGAEIAEVSLTPWIILMTIFLAVFLTLCKRRDDIYLLQGQNRKEGPYSLKTLNILIPAFVFLNIATYIFWSFQPDTHARLGSSMVIVTSVFVLAGFLRYLWRVYRSGLSSEPVQSVLQDRWLQAVLIAWCLSLALIVYL